MDVDRVTLWQRSPGKSRIFTFTHPWFFDRECKFLVWVLLFVAQTCYKSSSLLPSHSLIGADFRWENWSSPRCSVPWSLHNQHCTSAGGCPANIKKYAVRKIVHIACTSTCVFWENSLIVSTLRNDWKVLLAPPRLLQQMLQLMEPLPGNLLLPPPVPLPLEFLPPASWRLKGSWWQLLIEKIHPI